MAHLGKEEPIFNIMYIEKIWNTKVYTSKPETSNRYIPRERFLDLPPPVPPPSFNFVHGSDRKCLNLT